MKLAIHNYLEILALFTSILFYSRLRVSYLKWMPAFLLFTIISELGSKILKLNYGHSNTSWIYNVFIVIQIAFFLVFYYVESNIKLYKRVFLLFICSFLIFHLINISLWQGFYKFNYFSYLWDRFLL